jgi:hypothetical protein
LRLAPVGHHSDDEERAPEEDADLKVSHHEVRVVQRNGDSALRTIRGIRIPTISDTRRPAGNAKTWLATTPGRLAPHPRPGERC